jgi:hypothetical protein
MDWIHLAQDRDKWQSFVNEAMKLWVPQNAGTRWLDEELSASQGLCSMELVREKLLPVAEVCETVMSLQGN